MKCPSYPNFLRESDCSIRFAVPNTPIVQKIFNSMDEDTAIHSNKDNEDLRKLAAANILYKRVKRLADLFSQNRIEVKVAAPNELEVELFLPPPPRSQPRQTTPKSSKPYLKRAWKRFQPKLEAIPELLEASELRPASWVALYQYLPKRKRHAMYALLD
ncbi:hypothetical protein DM02DRAFT_665298 [Periconia macrospinosa]|uniref:Uncharacterized protein n=1 Tax=Periconia macrospinosa TaxID=97972 RepID=A0A2V1CXQ3_9PLEO|nr:hypothetical protein DM02DRAFT_665298 [Periconia macrospinosa]